MTHIIEGIFYYTMGRLDLLPDSDIEEVNRRKNVCSKCPLRSGNFCTRKKALRVSTGDRFERLPKVMNAIPYFIKPKNGEFVFKMAIWKTGCSCYLPFKWHSSSNCPLYKW